MRLRILSVLMVGFCFVACESKKIAQLQHQNDSLRHELSTRNSLLVAMYEAAALLDSIEINNQYVADAASQQPYHEQFSVRLHQINQYIKRSQQKINVMERELSSTKNEAFAYLMMVDALKGEVGIRDGEIEVLADSVEVFESQNSGLSQNLKAKEEAMANLYRDIKEKQQKLMVLEEKVTDMVRLTEADAYYARARSIEENAKKIKLAPVKRKETYRESLELYKKSFSLGNKQAEPKILQIQKMFAAENSFVADNDTPGSSNE
jgi:chromosome segregation ATPase